MLKNYTTLVAEPGVIRQPESLVAFYVDVVVVAALDVVPSFGDLSLGMDIIITEWYIFSRKNHIWLGVSWYSL